MDREEARFSTWYELFPRSCASDSGRHGTLKDCEARLPYIASMGFDVVYLSPCSSHRTHAAKGARIEVQLRREAGDVGSSPWAIGSEEGGHTSVHPQLGTLQNFKQFVGKAKELGLEVAIDMAFQCAPDHPYVKEPSRLVPDASRWHHPVCPAENHS